MRITVVHDSQQGNGAHLADIMKYEFEQAGHEVQVGHVSELDPETVAGTGPDLVVIGMAIRKFVASPPTKRWVRSLDRALRGRGASVGHAALFMTHGLPIHVAKRWAERFQRRLSRQRSLEKLYPEWFSGRVTAPTGHLEDGTEQRCREHARALMAWVAG